MALFLLILKILLIFTAAVIGLILLLVLPILFIPFCYSARAEYFENADASFSVSWLFRAVCLSGRYREKSFFKELRIFGIKVKLPEKKTKSSRDGDDESDTGEDNNEDNKGVKALNLKEFFADERTEFALEKSLMLVGKMLSHILPRELSGEVLFGMEEPDSTGKILAILSASLPIHRNRIKVTPDFTRKVFEGEIKISGRILLIVPVILVLRILLDKNVRYVTKQIKANRKRSEV